MEGRFSFESLVHDAGAAYLDHETGAAVLALAKLTQAGHGRSWESRPPGQPTIRHSLCLWLRLLWNMLRIAGRRG
ncbi:hypothetical protein EDD34_0917 [Myceligenerans xiligouense]|uniref:Uncharacterized protein n=1 Tax=Myceligenerans xiligouense TaxID=253184 RepID=A0A3N4ZK74_9MICO|nr:hypothetical protein EDD34_0917 [Myceligenerans xiligouense]